jgi:hypothetical protein
VLARTWPDGANIGVGCRASGVIGLDLDRHDGGPDGVAVFAALCRVYGQPWPDTLTVATPHDGRHLYFRIPPGTAAASTISRWPASTSARLATGPAATSPAPARSSTAQNTLSTATSPPLPSPAGWPACSPAPRRFRDTGADVEVSAVPGR